MLNHKSIDEDTTLVLSPTLKRLHNHLRDLIIVACETSMQAPSKSLCLTRLEYVSDEKREGKFSMHLNALVRERDRNAAIPIQLTIIAEAGD